MPVCSFRLFMPVVLALFIQSVLAGSPPDSPPARRYEIRIGRQFELCREFADFLEGQPEGILDRNVLLEPLRKHGHFDIPDWKLLPDGEERFGQIPMQSVIQSDAVSNPGWGTLEERKKGVLEAKSRAGGYDYYLAEMDVDHSKLQRSILLLATKNSFVDSSGRDYPDFWFYILNNEYSGLDDKYFLENYFIPFKYEGAIYFLRGNFVTYSISEPFYSRHMVYQGFPLVKDICEINKKGFLGH